MPTFIHGKFSGSGSVSRLRVYQTPRISPISRPSAARSSALTCLTARH